MCLGSEKVFEVNLVGVGRVFDEKIRPVGVRHGTTKLLKLSLWNRVNCLHPNNTGV